MTLPGPFSPKSDQIIPTVQNPGQYPEIEGTDPARPSVPDLEYRYGHGPHGDKNHHQPSHAPSAPFQQFLGRIYLTVAKPPPVQDGNYSTLTQEIIQGLHQEGEDNCSNYKDELNQTRLRNPSKRAHNEARVWQAE